MHPGYNIWFYGIHPWIRSEWTSFQKAEIKHNKYSEWPMGPTKSLSVEAVFIKSSKAEFQDMYKHEKNRGWKPST